MTIIPSGEDIKKAPGLLKSNANHFYNNAHSARPGAYTLCRAVSIFCCYKVIGNTKVHNLLENESI